MVHACAISFGHLSTAMPPRARNNTRREATPCYSVLAPLHVTTALCWIAQVLVIVAITIIINSRIKREMVSHNARSSFLSAVPPNCACKCATPACA